MHLSRATGLSMVLETIRSTLPGTGDTLDREDTVDFTVVDETVEITLQQAQWDQCVNFFLPNHPFNQSVQSLT